MIRVLVIEDDVDSQEVYTEILETGDFEIVAKGIDGKQAEELYKKHNPDLVLMDVIMDKYDGFYGLEKITEYDPKAKIILITSGMAATTQKKLLNTNASGLIFKPIEMSYLFKVIDLVLKGERVIPKSVRSTQTHTEEMADD